VTRLLGLMFLSRKLERLDYETFMRRRKSAPADESARGTCYVLRMSVAISVRLRIVSFVVVIAGFFGLQACSTSSSSAAPDASVAADASPGDAEVESGKDAVATDVECTTPMDCVQPGTKQNQDCWSCVKHVCVPIPAGADPNGVCPGTGCMVSTCNGLGVCSGLVNRPADTPCGTVCSFIGFGPDFGLRRARCVGPSCVGEGGDAGLLLNCGYCTGPNETCDKCPAAGCSAKCSTDLNSHLSCP
jgi:hypothetical protein